LSDGVTDAEVSPVFNNAARRVIKDVFKHAQCQTTYYHTQVLKQQMKTKDVQNLHMTKEYLQGSVDWLVKDLKA
jgi:hypothetical protein